MPGFSERVCPLCGILKKFRNDAKTCGCAKQRTVKILSEMNLEKNEISGGGNRWEISLPKTRIHTLEELIEYCKVDLAIWKVDRFTVNKWEYGTREGTITPLFQVKAILIKNEAVNNAIKEIEELKKLSNNFRPSPPAIKRDNKADNLLEIGMPDHHFGKLAWGEETGQGNYDVKIARVIFNNALNALIERTRVHKFESVLFVVGNDVLNSDDAENMTTAGTAVTTDGRFQKTFSVVRTIIIDSIEKLRKIAPVNVLMVPGNHDRLSVWHLGDSLECWFHNYKDVKVDNRPLYRKYVRFGKVMLMFTHGDKGKKDNYPLLMATEEPHMFGETKFREIHTAHTHQVGLKEQNGVRTRILPSLGHPDDWHYDHGFIGNIRSAEAYVWNKNEGLTNVAFYTDRDTPNT